MLGAYIDSSLNEMASERYIEICTHGLKGCHRATKVNNTSTLKQTDYTFIIICQFVCLSVGLCLHHLLDLI